MTNEGPPDRVNLLARITSHWRMKLRMAAGLTVAFCVPYFLLMHFPVRPIQPVPTIWLDDAIAFDPRWIWVYQSIYLLINPLPWLATAVVQLRQFATGFLLLCGVSFVVFLIYPTHCPRPQIVNPTGMYWFLLLYDRPNNAFPSLHAGLLVYTLLFVWRLMRDDVRLRRSAVFSIVYAALCIWGLAILYATVATKEHYAIDILVGAGLGACAHLFAGRLFRGQRVFSRPNPPAP